MGEGGWGPWRHHSGVWGLAGCCVDRINRLTGNAAVMKLRLRQRRRDLGCSGGAGGEVTWMQQVLVYEYF